ncbi:MAG: thioesterase family protein [Bacteroidetes bacterium]|nr:thioesterase family protein [Bacteroidota bacterium]MDA0875223.1 thioesterase family protein [Bacteroidota bacterium]
MEAPPHTFHHRVRFRECDPMGIAYHVHYLDWFEYARTEALRDLGVPYKEIADSGITLPVTHLEIDYKESARYDDMIRIETRARLSASTVRIACHYRVLRDEDDRLLATGRVDLCFLDPERNRPVRAPESVTALVPVES